MNKQEFIKTKIEELVKELDGEVNYYDCFTLHNEHKKIEIIYDRQKRQNT